MVVNGGLVWKGIVSGLIYPNALRPVPWEPLDDGLYPHVRGIKDGKDRICDAHDLGVVTS